MISSVDPPTSGGLPLPKSLGGQLIRNEADAPLSFTTIRKGFCYSTFHRVFIASFTNFLLGARASMVQHLLRLQDNSATAVAGPYYHPQDLGFVAILEGIQWQRLPAPLQTKPSRQHWYPRPSRSIRQARCLAQLMIQ